MKKVAILGGGGLMGHGMALACRRSPGTEVVLLSRCQESLDHGAELVRSGQFGIERGVERGKITQEQADDMSSRLRLTLDYDEGLATADLVFETVPEVLATKQEVLAEAERITPPTAIFAIGTSSIMISELAGMLEDPGCQPPGLMEAEFSRSGGLPGEVLGRM